MPAVAKPLPSGDTLVVSPPPGWWVYRVDVFNGEHCTLYMSKNVGVGFQYSAQHVPLELLPREVQ